MTTKMLIVRFLDTHRGVSVASHTIQKDISDFALAIYGKAINPATVDRTWRLLREDTEFLKQNGYSIIEDLSNTGKEKKFIIRRISEIHRDSQGKSESSAHNNSTFGSQESSGAREGTL